MLLGEHLLRIRLDLEKRSFIAQFLFAVIESSYIESNFSFAASGKNEFCARRKVSLGMEPRRSIAVTSWNISRRLNCLAINKSLLSLKIARVNLD